MLSAISHASKLTVRKMKVPPSSLHLKSYVAQMKHQRMKSSASVATFIPESIKDAVKSSVLEEAARHDSKLWGDSAENTTKINGNTAAHTNIDPHRVGSNVDGNVNHPISPARLQMLHDPLDEWYLDRKPSSQSENTKSEITPETDPFILSKSDMQSLSESIRTDLIGSDHPVLSKAASYFFEEGQDGGKKVRPMMVLLLSRAMQEASATTVAAGSHTIGNSPQANVRPDLFQAQRRLAEISEMIHTASLFHDDVIDGADTRRGAPAVHKVFGDKMAILAGDYLLARASIFLARLRDVEVVETMSTIIEHLVRGEVMQMKGADRTDSENERMIQYLRKNFYKTASLMANSCKSAAILGNYDDEVVGAAYRYGKHLGIAFQLVDDVLDFDGSASILGKPLLSDLNAGLATAPVLFASETFSDELTAMMDRKFRNDGDVDRAVELVRQTDGIQRTKDLAQVHVELAIESISELGPSAYRESLIHLAHKVVDRTR